MRTPGGGFFPGRGSSQHLRTHYPASSGSLTLLLLSVSAFPNGPSRSLIGQALPFALVVSQESRGDATLFNWRALEGNNSAMAFRKHWHSYIPNL
jgi:hypothetical protein